MLMISYMEIFILYQLVSLSCFLLISAKDFRNPITKHRVFEYLSESSHLKFNPKLVVPEVFEFMPVLRQSVAECGFASLLGCCDGRQEDECKN